MIRALVVGVVSVLLLAPVARAQDGLSVTIEGEPVVGATLRAVVVGADPTAELAYTWRRCRDGRRSCERITGATEQEYVPVAEDVGLSLVVFVTYGELEARSEPTAPVTAAPDAEPTPTPSPDPSPEPDPAPDPDPPPAPTPDAEPTPAPAPDPTPTTGPAPVVDQSSGPQSTTEGELAPSPTTFVIPSPDTGLRYLQPFPVVRIRGSLTARGADVALLLVTGPPRARVEVRCAGAACPFRVRARRTGRIRALERLLPAGTTITVRVQRRGRIGKYVRIRIRAGAAPARRDACLLPGSTRPAACPTA